MLHYAQFEIYTVQVRWFPLEYVVLPPGLIDLRQRDNSIGAMTRWRRVATRRMSVTYVVWPARLEDESVCLMAKFVNESWTQ